MESKVAPRAPVFRGYPVMPRPVIPLGLETLYAACRLIYPDQPNPLQVTALVKYWLGGPDPLDYISMYSNPGNQDSDISPHWHYVSFGLSDLHGDGRVHDISERDTPSGYGFELSFRLKREPSDRVPPTWPAAIMQALAKYVFQSENTLCAGDHVSWHCPLDNSESRIQHMLMFEDPQLGTVQTPFGPVAFIQIVGVCTEELQAAQGWNGPGIIDLMKSVRGAGGPWLITDMRRGETIFELDSSAQEAVDQGVLTDGSNLSGVSAKCSWHEKRPSMVIVKSEEEENELDSVLPHISVSESEQIKATLKKGLLSSKPVLPQIRPNSSNRYYGMCAATDQNEGNSRKDSYDSNMNSEVAALEPAELMQTKFLDSVHLQFNLEAGSVLPLALRGRLKHGRHFTFKSVVGDVAITLVPTSVSGAFVDVEHPFAAHGPWLQVLLTDEEIEMVLEDMKEIDELDAVALPKTFEWPEKRLSMTLFLEEYHHGTRCAGEVAAKRDNNVCGVGVAYESKVAGIRMLDQPYMTDLIEANSMGHEPNLIDIYSASWGPTDDGKTVDGPRNATMRAIVRGVNEGRRGLGNIYVWASGDGGEDDDCNCDGYAASMWTISINSAINTGENAHYDESCSSTLASTFSNGAKDPHTGVATTDLYGKCTKTHSGTSAAAPEAAGVFALALDANPNLTWRDVQHLTVLTSKRNSLYDSKGRYHWNMNGVGLEFNHLFGFGVLDAGAMVALAKIWKTVPPRYHCEAGSVKTPHQILGNASTQIYIDTDACSSSETGVNYLEHVQAIITLNATRRGDVTLFLISPMGTRSMILSKRPNDDDQYDGFTKWPFMTTHTWGEGPKGRWTLEVKFDSHTPQTGFLREWTLMLHGTRDPPYKDLPVDDDNSKLAIVKKAHEVGYKI